MEFASYSIFRESDNSRVSLKEIDPLVCRELGLEFSEKDYGHFHFPEREKEKKGGQGSISWAGLLYVIAYYSYLRYGRCSKYDVESAMAWVRHYAVTFPPSVMQFTTKLMNLLAQHGLYVHCDFTRDNGRENEFICEYYGETMYLNESGVFHCSIGFKLVHYYPTHQNILREPPVREEYECWGEICKEYYSVTIDTLIIPSGIRSIDRDFFERGYVEKSVALPDSLQRLEGFNETFIGKITIPAGVKFVDSLAFRKSTIHMLRLESIGDCEFHRSSFSESKIENLSIPASEMNRVKYLPFIEYVRAVTYH